MVDQMLSAVGVLVLVVLLWMLARVLRRIIVRPAVIGAEHLLERRGIRWRIDALSACHHGLIVAHGPDTHDHCAACGDPVSGGSGDFWTRYAAEMRAAGDARNADDIAWEARDAIRVVRDDLSERIGQPFGNAISRPR